MKNFLPLILLLSTSTTALAEDSTTTPYFFGSYTSSKLNYDDDSTHKSNVSFGGGIFVNKNLAIELGYKEFGKSTSEKRTEDLVNEDLDFEYKKYEAKALILRAIVALPITNELSLEGFVGAAAVHTKAEKSASSINLFNGHEQMPLYEPSSTTKNALVPTIGLGATYNVGHNLSVFTRYEYVVLPKIDNARSKSHSVDIGLRYHF